MLIVLVAIESGLWDHQTTNYSWKFKLLLTSNFGWYYQYYFKTVSKCHCEMLTLYLPLTWIFPFLAAGSGLSLPLLEFTGLDQGTAILHAKYLVLYCTTPSEKGNRKPPLHAEAGSYLPEKSVWKVRYERKRKRGAVKKAQNEAEERRDVS